jgi:hypothetical protein
MSPQELESWLTRSGYGTVIPGMDMAQRVDLAVRIVYDPNPGKRPGGAARSHPVISKEKAFEKANPTEDEVRKYVEDYVVTTTVYRNGFSTNMKIFSIDALPSYYLELTSFTEKRERVERQVPYNGQPTPHGVPPSIEDMEFHFSSVYTPETKERDIPFTHENIICHMCNGRGDVICPRCHGTRRTTCFICHGSGRTYRTEYHTEYRSGRSVQASRQVVETCFTCHGCGHVPCSHCGASGRVRCDLCQGRCRLLRWFVCVVTWGVPRSREVINPAADHARRIKGIDEDDILPTSTIEGGSGPMVWEEEGALLRVARPDGPRLSEEVQAAAARLLAPWQAGHLSGAFLICQKLQIKGVPVYIVEYEHSGGDKKKLYITGLERTITCHGYPRSWFCFMACCY